MQLLDDPDLDPWYRKMADSAGLTSATHRHPNDMNRECDIACGGQLRVVVR